MPLAVAAAILATSLFFPQSQTGCLSATAAPKLPVPTGPFHVGRVTYFWTDPSRPEPFSATPDAHREVVVYVWYPAEKAANNKKNACYFPDFDAARAAISAADLKGMLRPATEQIQANGLPLLHAVEGAEILHGHARYPVLIFSHGWGLQSPLYSATLEDFASHGYIVAAVDHPYDTTVTVFPDGHIAKFAQDKFDAAAKKPHGYIDFAYERIQVMAEDVRFVVDQLARYDRDPKLGAPFARRLDLEKVGAFGHSIGGMTSARACQIDTRIRACVDEDSIDDVGSPFSVITPGSIPAQPFLLFIAASADIFSAAAVHPTDESLAQQKLTRAEYDKLIQTQQQKQNDLLSAVIGGAYRVMLFDLPGITHRSFSDLPLLAAAQDAQKEASALQNFQIIQAYLRGFFDKHLKRDSHTVLDSKSPPDSRVKVDRFGLATQDRMLIH
jgi:predicted dienelactone hydrolase